MLRCMNNLKHYSMKAIDGVVGEVKDFRFDDVVWVIRYFAVEVVAWVPSSRVLISLIAIQKANSEEKNLLVLTSTEQIRQSPERETDKPACRQHEMDYHRYYADSYDWGGAGFRAGGIYPYACYSGFASSRLELKGSLAANRAHGLAEYIQEPDPNLRGCQAVVGYHRQRSDGGLGHALEFIVKDSTRTLRYFVMATCIWWGGHEIGNFSA
jgi:hypothetical protein